MSTLHQRFEGANNEAQINTITVNKLCAYCRKSKSIASNKK